MADSRSAFPLVRNKVNPPHYTTPTLRRERLLTWLDDHKECRAIVVAADAGYGKTTLLWQWGREAEFPCFWFKLDKSDRDWTLHVSYLVEGIARLHPGFGERAQSMLQQTGGHGSNRPGVVAYLLADMHDQLVEPCTFVIDDWHFVAKQTEVRGLWNQILRDAPPTCRFIFLSRARPRLQFARFRTHGGYAELGTDDLRFTEVEISSLFRDIYSDPLDTTELAELDRRTEGWAASLQLVEVSLRGRRTQEERRAFIESITADSDSDLFEFLAEEVLDQQDEETRNFLLSTSILRQITPELAERLTGVGDGGLVLADLEQRGLFTSRLSDEEVRYRYHGLFRDFLERRLAMDRSQAEVVGLHIHAASYFETTLHWPEAIHHYLRAGLRRQAARLIAKYGEGVVATGQLELIDDWLAQLPAKVVHDNARLSLLQGEAIATIRGDWQPALIALERGRDFFVRKGDTRMVALADLKLSTVHHYLGDAKEGAAVAARGLEESEPADHETRLRLRGNMAISAMWLDPLERVERDYEQLAEEASSRGLFHYAAIGRHNLAVTQFWMGHLTESIANFEETDRFWGSLSSSPFGDNADYVAALLAAGEVPRAELAAKQGISRTRDWPRPHAEAEIGRTEVLMHLGDFDGAARSLKRLLVKQEILGGLAEIVAMQLIGALYLGGCSSDELRAASDLLAGSPEHPALVAPRAVAIALLAHGLGECDDQCRIAWKELQAWEARGARLVAAMGFVQVAALLLEHSGDYLPDAGRALSAADQFAVLPHMRWWTRRYAPFADQLMPDVSRWSILRKVASADIGFWQPVLVRILAGVSASSRPSLLEFLRDEGDSDVARLLAGVPGADIAELRRGILRTSAERLFVRAFGPLTIHRGDWNGSEVRLDKRRLRLLLGLLVANRHRTLTREMATEALWPDHDPGNAVNNLNQAIFQLRRHLSGGSKDPDRAQYVISSPDMISLDPDLVTTDLDEVRRLAATLQSPVSGAERQAAVVALLGLVRGEFLADLRYEEWTSGIQVSVAAEVREPLLAVANASPSEVPPHLSLRAAEMLTEFDPYDESAHVAMARKLFAMGRRAAARRLIVEFAATVEEELQASPSAEVVRALAELGDRQTAVVQ